jgi:MbtH protein
VQVVSFETESAGVVACNGSIKAKESVMSNEQNASAIYKVVVNHEEQYSIWPDYRELPSGWRVVGKDGTKEQCLSYIAEVWTDMRPLSLRKRMDAASVSI